MNTNEIAGRLVDLCREGKFEEAQNELFASDATSIEPYETPEFPKVTQGLDAIQEKGRRWMDMVSEYHGVQVSDPILADTSFATSMTMDVTMKEKGRMKMTELCVYKVKDGKIISEEFIM